MAFVNYNNKEITVKIVYYGPALSGKTTCLQYTYSSKEYKKKGKLITLDTDGDRTLFFDFLPLEIGKLGDYSIKMQLYTVPGQVAYDTTRKLVLQGSDGVVFVADSQVVMREQNIASFNNLKENLKANNISFEETPLIYQYNKRDLKEILPNEVLNKDLNQSNKPFFPTIGTTGENILEGLQTIMKMVILHLKNKLTVFQKDKTVMFSRDEISDTIATRQKVDAMKKEFESTDMEMEDTEKEEVFELSGPLEDDSLKTNYREPLQLGEMNREPAPEAEEEIFNLGDESMVPGDGLDLEIPDAVIKDELGDVKEESANKMASSAPPVVLQDNAPVVKDYPPPMDEEPIASLSDPIGNPEPFDNDVPITLADDEPDSLQEETHQIALEPESPLELVADDAVALTPDMEQQHVVYARPTDNDNQQGADSDKNVSIPLNITVPKDKDEINININLRIVIKRN
ncbi:MAG: GTPase domain-containing protein [bacterium]|nr:GTPase domain-containing protein [bacterium]